ncbi:(2E,6E)-farnesyl diphosphate synthase [Corynebacterium kalinowskii]|uniref:(2E,6E)-farnesyl diphosphate synthase n=1 Tax=Corynebacterium kalinowskii TaxID=2675216 RepID=A0A6B8VSK2_9CORY|nr:polyprenyl synthetase family protein [Corynebacterium kalinowskii]QGU01706.1 (2E,6E)-farnesyl diphosphate synthase [Corynebacterium kalinowskii]
MTVSDAEKLTLSEFPAAVSSCLEEFFNSKRDMVMEIDPIVSQAVTLLEDMVLGGGKRMRPMFAWTGYWGAKGHEAENPNAVLRAVSALEFIQACALIHDDIIDASDTRRGSPTVHRRVEALHGTNDWKGDAADFGTGVAILIGDLALSWAEEMLQTSGLSCEALARVREPWSAMKTEVIAGQILDISVESSGNEDPDIAEKVNRFKTAAYTIERPLHIGAALADAPAPLIDAYRAFGHDIGIAFQLRDDLLGVFGDPSVTGKPAGDDLREGKRTVLFAEALKAADATDPAQAAALRAGIGATADPKELAELAGIIRELGAEDVVEKRIAELTTSGLAHLDAADMPDKLRTSLHELAIRATKRAV